MLHEIAPKSFHIEWKNIQPEPDDRILFLVDGQILAVPGESLDIPLHGAHETLHTTAFPKRSAFEKWSAFPLIRPDSGAFTYLFAVDDERYFTMVYDEEAFLLRAGGREALQKSAEDEGLHFFPVRMMRSVEPMYEAFAGMMGGMLAGYYRRSRFCGKCGSRTEHSPKERMMYCPTCKNSIFPQICPSVIVGVLSSDGERLLTTRYNPTHLMYDGAGHTFKPVVHDALVAGYIESGETAEDAVRREVMEEVGLRVRNIRYLTSAPWPLSSGLLLGYLCEAEGDETICLEKAELSEARFKTREEIEERPGRDISLTYAIMDAFRRGKLPAAQQREQ